MAGLFFVFWVENTFGSLATPELRSQVRGDSSKNLPDGRSQAPGSEEDSDHVMSGPLQDRRHVYPDSILGEAWTLFLPAG